MMRFSLVVCMIFLLLLTSCLLGGQSRRSRHVPGQSSICYAVDHCVDSEGNIYLTGYFAGIVTIDPGRAEKLITAGAEHTLYLAKYSRVGTLQWVKTGDLDENCRTYAIAHDESTGNILIACDLMRPDDKTGYMEFVVRAFDSDGEMLWETPIDYNADMRADIIPDSSGAYYITGLTGTMVQHEDGEYGWGPGTDWLRKIDMDGTVESRFSLDSQNCTLIPLVDAGPSGDVFVVTPITSDLVLQGIDGNEVTLVNKDTDDYALIVYNSDGKYKRYLRWSIDTKFNLESLSVDSRGNAYIAGPFHGTMTFGTADGMETVTSGDDWDCLLFKINPDNELEWSWVWGADDPNSDGVEDYTHFVLCDDDDTVWLTSSHNGDVDLDPGERSRTARPIHPGEDFTLLLHLDPDSNIITVKQYENDFSDFILDSDGNVVLVDNWSQMHKLDPDGNVKWSVPLFWWEP